MPHTQKTISLSGARIVEFDICRQMIEAAGVPPHQISNQRVMSAVMQTFMAHMKAGMKIAWQFDDARADNGPGEEKTALREARERADVHRN